MLHEFFTSRSVRALVRPTVAVTLILIALTGDPVVEFLWRVALSGVICFKIIVQLSCVAIFW